MESLKDGMSELQATAATLGEGMTMLQATVTSIQPASDDTDFRLVINEEMRRVRLEVNSLRDVVGKLHTAVKALAGTDCR